MSTKARLFLGPCCLALCVACGTNKGEEDAGETGSAPECQAIDPSAPEQDCGTYEENMDMPCEDGGDDVLGTDSATDGGSGTGGGGSEGGLSEQCAEIAANNDAVVACILQADADGAAFVFGHNTRNISIFTSSRYHVRADGTMWRTNDDALDLCFENGTRAYGEVSFASCDAWDCILAQVEAAPLLATCEYQNSCG